MKKKKIATLAAQGIYQRVTTVYNICIDYAGYNDVMACA